MKRYDWFAAVACCAHRIERVIPVARHGRYRQSVDYSCTQVGTQRGRAGAGLTIWSRARILIPLNRTDKPTDDESGRKTWEMKNGTDVFRGGSTDILTTDERGIYPSGGQRFVTKGRNIDAACRSIFLVLLFSSRILADSVRPYFSSFVVTSRACNKPTESD